MFGKKKEPRIIKLSELREIERAKQAEKQMERAIENNLKTVEKMDKKTYLKYYISILENQIKEATKILEQKKRELRFLR